MPAVGYALFTRCGSALLSSITVFCTSGVFACSWTVLCPRPSFWLLVSSIIQSGRVRFACSLARGLVVSQHHSLFSARCACRERRLLEILQRDIAFSSSALAVIMALHELPTMALHGSPASLHASPCVSTSCLLVHVLTHVFSSARFSRARLLWLVVVLVDLAGLTSTTCVPSRLCAWRSFCFPQTLVILLW